MAGKKKQFDPSWADNVMNQWQGDSDRSICITGGAILDELLLRLIKHATAEETPDDVFTFEGPVGTFSGRIKLAYAMGLITTQEFDDLKTVRDIRNIFAHHIDQHYTFRTDAISSRVKNLKLLDLWITHTATLLQSPDARETLDEISAGKDFPKERFTYSIFVLTDELTDRVKKVRKAIVFPSEY